ncbi:molecular chaperone TorD family protein [Shewanella olleyana]|uniref:TorD/DmsD family molecular chaperone n=1 Tax=Shewanella olleyana TaxID=135626 RepID=UPI00200FC875|nr:molecular chaperone TorD family protein [Shewanella olleyana]MCL1067383.1 molecular chaperone TorD family protein [Shewanella olleyana]
MSSRNELLELSGAMFNILSEIFYTAPSESKLNTISETLEEWPLFSGSPEKLIASINQSLNNDTPDEISADFHKLFIGPGKKLVYPWGSCYTDQQALLFGESTKKWEQFCLTTEIVITPKSYEPTDHFALIFSAISAILLSENTEEEKSELLEIILSNHFNDWGVALLQSVKDKACTSYYSATASLALNLIDFWNVEFKKNAGTSK